MYISNVVSCSADQWTCMMLDNFDVTLVYCFVCVPQGTIDVIYEDNMTSIFWSTIFTYVFVVHHRK